MSGLAFLRGRLPSIRFRLLASFAVLAVSTLVVGIVAWYWLVRSNAILEDLHHTTLLEVSRSHDLAEQASNLTTSAPFLLNLKSPYLVESEGGTLLGSIDSAIALWQTSAAGAQNDSAEARQIVATLTGMRGSVVALIEATQRLARSGDDIRGLTRQLTGIERGLAGMSEAADPAGRDAVRRAQLAANLLIMASGADSLIGVGEYRRRFYAAVNAIDAARLAAAPADALGRLVGLADGDNGLFQTQYEAVQNRIASHQALSAISTGAAELAAQVSDFIGAAEVEISRRREQTSNYLAYARILVAVSGLASIALALISAIYVSRYVTGNINSIATAITKLAAGDHTHDLPRRSKQDDEIGKLLEVFRVFRANAIRLERSNRQLRRKTALFEAIFNNIHDGIAITDADGRLVEHNGRLAALFRFFGGAEDIGKGCALEKVLAAHIDAAGETIDVGFESDSGFRQLRNRLGQVLEVRTNELPDGGKIWLFSDSTERSRVEERLRRFQRLESLGQLTGEVAHDFNNILSAIATTLPRLEKTENTAAAEALANIDDALDIGTALTQRLLAFARKQHLEPETVELNELVLGVRELIAISLGDDIDLTVETHPEKLHTRIDPGQLESALLNLCLNSAQAIDGKGRVAIRINPDGDAFVCVSVEDDGCGMEPDVAERALEPFFSTRRGMQGSGLGLSMVYGFIRQSEGELMIASDPGKGTVVTMKLPPAGADADRPQIAPVPPGTTVAIVEDDAETLAYAARVLRQLNCATLSFDTYDRAQAAIEQGSRFDVLLTDLHLGAGKSGWDLAAFCLARRPETAVVVTSGRRADLAREPDELKGRISILEKPYDADRLRLLLSGEDRSADRQLTLQGA